MYSTENKVQKNVQDYFLNSCLHRFSLILSGPGALITFSIKKLWHLFPHYTGTSIILPILQLPAGRQRDQKTHKCLFQPLAALSSLIQGKIIPPSVLAPTVLAPFVLLPP
jgi:hypothetical protein